MSVSEAMSADTMVVAGTDGETVTRTKTDTYALTYAAGIVWLFVSIALLGAQKQFSFTPAYDLLLGIPPLMTALTVLVADRSGAGLWIPVRAFLLATVCAFVSALSTVVLAPLLVLSFREGVTGDLGLTGMIASFVLAAVAAPMVPGLARALRRGHFGRAAVLAAGLFAAGLALAMTLDPTGALASSMRLDQARIMMVVASYWLPVYALTAAFVRDSALL